MEVLKKQAISESSMSAKYCLTSEVYQGFDAGFLDESFCREFILKKLHPAGSVCPECFRTLEKRSAKSFWEGRRVKCKNCGKFFKAVSKTFLTGVHISFSQFVLLAVFLEAGLSNKQIAGLLKTTPETVRLWRLKLQTLSIIKNTG